MRYVLPTQHLVLVLGLGNSVSCEQVSTGYDTH